MRDWILDTSFPLWLHFLVRALHMICQALHYSALCLCHNDCIRLHYLTSYHCSKCRGDICMQDSDNSNKHSEGIREIDKNFKGVAK